MSDTSPNKLTLTEVERLIVADPTLINTYTTPREILEQLSDTMRENERLREALQGYVNYDNNDGLLRHVGERALHQHKEPDNVG